MIIFAQIKRNEPPLSDADVRHVSVFGSDHVIALIHVFVGKV